MPIDKGVSLGLCPKCGRMTLAPHTDKPYCIMMNCLYVKDPEADGEIIIRQLHDEITKAGKQRKRVELIRVSPDTHRSLLIAGQRTGIVDTHKGIYSATFHGIPLLFDIKIAGPYEIATADEKKE